MGDYLQRAQELVERPSESLAVEIKTWIDPAQPEGAAKIVRTVLALHNNNGGYMIIGFNNKTLLPDLQDLLADVKTSFHPDEIQRIVAKYASEPIEIFVEFPELAGNVYPVLVVPGGVKTPVATKSELVHGTKKLISIDKVYVRTLRANNTPSSAEATSKDWARITELCLENREADIGRFLRRHLASLSPEILQEVGSQLVQLFQPQKTAREHTETYLQDSSARFWQVALKRKVELPRHGHWEVAMLINGEIPEYSANQQFLSLLEASNPQYSGWPVWMISRAFRDEKMNPYTFEGVWEEFMCEVGSPSLAHYVVFDFARYDPKGRFYLRRAYQEDMGLGTQPVKPFSILDFVWPISATAEAIAVGLAFARAMKSSPNTYLEFAFRWSGLEGRKLVAWSHEGRLWPKGPTHDDVVTAFISVPLETPLSSIADFVDQVIKRLFQAFDGFTLEKSLVEDFTRKTIERRRYGG